MSKRFGRNQRRKLTQLLADCRVEHMVGQRTRDNLARQLGTTMRERDDARRGNVEEDAAQ